MVGCDNDKCEIEWVRHCHPRCSCRVSAADDHNPFVPQFHIKCVNLTPPLPETWFCPTCTALGAGRKRGGGRK
jgi:chromatin modification-related protein YNG2